MSSGGPLPEGLPVLLDPGVQRLDGDRVLLGGDPGRLVRLSEGGPAALAALAAGRGSASARRLARTLVDAGLAHPRPAPTSADVVVVVPVRDRPGELARCLAALDGQRVLVVDDGSRDPAAVAAVARAAGADLLALPMNGGPAAARNAGLAATDAPLVAFLDSDCLPPPGWVDALAGHFADPALAAVAPRVQGTTTGEGLLARYAAARGPLDLGPREGRVRPGRLVPYVPSAALVVRRSAEVAFDPALRWGEDVDLVWRLHDRGWQVRYDPRTVVRHAEPDRWRDWLVRRYRYGTSAAPLSARHGARLAPLVLSPWPTAAVLLALIGRPLPATVAGARPAARLFRQLRATGLPTTTSARLAAGGAARGVRSTAAGLGGAGTVVTGPVLVALLAGRRTRRAAAVALLGPPLLEWLDRRPGVDPARWTAVRLVDDLAYALGVWTGCATGRTLAPLRLRTTRPQ